ncbi:MAG: aspartate kinase [Spirochaetaceae bacterium]|nr:MAG: aspartate kinase [Spirochaetaceae bacterium]
MRVLKFGGSSLADAQRIRGVCGIIGQARHREPIAVVLSAMKGVTNLLLQSAGEAAVGDAAYHDHALEIFAQHADAAETLFPATERASVLAPVEELMAELTELLRGVELVKECSPRTMDLIASFGERMSCRLVAAYLDSIGTPAITIDARNLIITDDYHGSAAVDFRLSYRLIAEALRDLHEVPIITGFIAATGEGVTTTLGRNGSDYTASLVGAAVGAGAIEIWTDVDGVLSADPRYVPEAFVVSRLSFKEAMELSYFGAEVIHPYTMVPAVEKNIPIWIRNTLNPGAAGTRISAEPVHDKHPITGIASIDNVSLVNVEGGGMVGVPGMAGRVFSTLARVGVNVIMISQASSEHSICIVCRQGQARAAIEGLQSELAHELTHKQIERFELIEDLEIIAVIGEKMRGTPGISGRLFSALGDAGINILAIAQGSTEMNISFLVHRDDRERTLQVVHRAFFGDGNGAGARSGRAGAAGAKR